MTPRIIQIITQIYRLPGSQTAYRVVLGCDHRPSVTGAELRRQHLFVGKAMECVECGRKEGQ
jgi:hypothetical protein